jgi:hypothetical protein
MSLSPNNKTKSYNYLLGSKFLGCFFLVSVRLNLYSRINLSPFSNSKPAERERGADGKRGRKKKANVRKSIHHAPAASPKHIYAPCIGIFKYSPFQGPIHANVHGPTKQQKNNFILLLVVLVFSLFGWFLGTLSSVVFTLG